MIIEALYCMMVEDLERCEKYNAKSIHSKFVDYKGKVRMDGERAIVVGRKRTHTLVLKSNGIYNKEYEIPWWGGKRLAYKWRG